MVAHSTFYHVEDSPEKRALRVKVREILRRARRTRCATETLHNCPICARCFRTRKLLNSHRTAVHASKRWLCARCGALFATPSKLRRHQTVHAWRLCRKPNCNKRFDSWTSLRKHVGEQHAATRRCVECGATLKTRAALTRHERAHAAAPPCPYTDCAIRVPTSRWRSHVRRFHKNFERSTSDGHDSLARRFSCDVCDKRFCTRRHVKRHVLEVHQKTRLQRQRYACSEEGCSRSFQTSTRLECHANVHRGVKPYVCTETDCSKSFCGREALSRHMAQRHCKRLNTVLRLAEAYS